MSTYSKKLAQQFSNAFCAVMTGLWLGAAVEAQAQAVDRSNKEDKLIQVYRDSESRATDERAAFHEREIDCLTAVMVHEAGGELPGHRRLAGLVYLARRDDQDPQWPKTVCAIANQPQL